MNTNSSPLSIDDFQLGIEFWPGVLKRTVESILRVAEGQNVEASGGFEHGSTTAADVGAGVLSRFVDGSGVDTSSFGFEDRNAVFAGIASSVGTGRGGGRVSRPVQEGWAQ